MRIFETNQQELVGSYQDCRTMLPRFQVFQDEDGKLYLGECVLVIGASWAGEKIESLYYCEEKNIWLYRVQSGHEEELSIMTEKQAECMVESRGKKDVYRRFWGE